jgi:hypothetical protein
MDNSFKVLNDNGIMWMNNYLGGSNGNIYNNNNILIIKR